MKEFRSFFDILFGNLVVIILIASGATLYSMFNNLSVTVKNLSTGMIKDRLYLTRAFRRQTYGFEEPTEPSRFLSDIPPELIEDNGKVSGSGRGGYNMSSSRLTTRQAAQQVSSRWDRPTANRRRGADGRRRIRWLPTPPRRSVTARGATANTSSGP